MGLIIESNCKSTISLIGGYGMLLTIREEVAKRFDKEFGEHYARLRYAIDDIEDFDKTTNEILSHSRFKDEDADIIDFLFASDCGGKINYKTCKKVVELIEDSDNKYCLRYAYYSKNDWEDLKQLLWTCYKRRANLIWR